MEVVVIYFKVLLQHLPTTASVEDENATTKHYVRLHLNN